MTAPLQLVGLCVTSGSTRLLDGVSLQVEAGKVHALIGESGSGKTLVSLSALGLLPTELTVSGAVYVAGVELVAASPRQREAVRGAGVAMVVQAPAMGLDPLQSVESHLAEVLGLRFGLRGAAAWARAVGVLREVGFEQPEAVRALRPHQLSGGMQQRVALAAVLASQPKVIIADEPTSALDGPLRAGILEVFQRLARTRGVAVLLTSHDVGLVRQHCDAVTVLSAGVVVESGTAEVLSSPKHAITQRLVRSQPSWATRGRPLRTSDDAGAQP